MIIAHNKFEQLKILVRLLDDSRHDLFIHVDKKAKDFNENEIRSEAKKSNVIFTERTKVTWGGYSQINSEMVLLKAATAYANYEYYHLLSGVDLPIKKNDQICEFFHSCQGKNFVGMNEAPLDRVKYYYFFQEKVGRNENFLQSFQGKLIALQKRLKIDRCKRKKCVWGKGANWF